MDENRVLRMPTGEVITIQTTGAESGGALFEFEATLPAWLSGPPAHWHRIEQEAFDVVEGTLRVRIGRQQRDLGAGESVVIAAGTVHAFSNPTAKPTRVITRETPAGQLEPQFRVLASGGRVPPLLQLAQINASHDLSFFLNGIPEVPQRVLWRALAGLARFRNRFS